MRRVGEVREAIDAAARELAAQRVGATWRELAAHAGVGYTAARFTVLNMVRAGELQRLGWVTPPGERYRCAVYGPPALAPGAPALDAVMRDWHKS